VAKEVWLRGCGVAKEVWLRGCGVATEVCRDQNGIFEHLAAER